MSGLFDPKPPAPIPTVNTSDAANRLNDALERRLQTGGTNADTAQGNQVAPMPMGRPSTLAGIS